MARKKNPAAVALAKLRLSRMSSEEPSAVGRAGARARHLSLTPKERREIAREAGRAGGRGRKKQIPAQHSSGSARKRE